MRWTDPPDGAERERSIFLFGARCLKGDHRWLEFAKICEFYSASGPYWYEVCWSDDPRREEYLDDHRRLFFSKKPPDPPPKECGSGESQ